MNIDLLIIGRRTFCDGDFDFSRLFMLLSDKGYEVKSVYAAETAEQIRKITSESENIIVSGNTDVLADVLGAAHEGEVAEKQYFKADNKYYYLLPVYDEDYIRDILIPLLNSRNRTFYNTVIFKVFGKTEHEVREILAARIGGRGKITFKFYESLLECEVHVTYSGNTSSAIVSETVNDVGEILSPYCYAVGDISLEKQTASLIRSHALRVSVAETFTKGNVVSSLSASFPCDNLFTDALIINSENGLTRRLGIRLKDLEEYGIISDETAYVMAGKLLANPECDVAVAVLGDFIGIGSEDNVFYIAVGDGTEIHVFGEHYFGSAEDMVRVGTKYAIYYLCKFLDSEKKQQGEF